MNQFKDFRAPTGFESQSKKEKSIAETATVQIDLTQNMKLKKAMNDSEKAESDMFEFDQSEKNLNQQSPEKSNSANLENMVIITTNILKNTENKKEVQAALDIIKRELAKSKNTS